MITQIHIHQQNILSTGSSQVADMEFVTSGTYIKCFWAQVKRQKLPILRNLTIQARVVLELVDNCTRTDNLFKTDE